MSLHTATAWLAALLLAASIFGHNVALRLLLLATGAILVLLVMLRSRDTLTPLPPIWIAFALWAAWAAASYLWSVDPPRTLKELRNEVVYTGFALWICFVGAQARHAMRIFLPLLGAGALLACALALRDFWRGWDVYQSGWHGGPGDHSSALLVLMPCAVMAGWYALRSGAPRSIVIASAGLVLLFFASAYTTLNRTIWLGFGVEFALIGGLLLRRLAGPAPLSRQTRAIGVGLAVLAIVVAGGMALHVQTERETLNMGAKPIEQDARLALWPEIFERIEERPLTGYGFGRSLLRESLQQKLGDVDTFLWHAHNVFLDAALQIGLPGLALLLVLLGAVALQGWRLAIRADDWAGACGIALLTVLAGVVVRNMTDTLLTRQNALLFWGIVGALLAFASRPWQASS